MGEHLPHEVTGLTKEYVKMITREFTWGRKNISVEEDNQKAKRMISDELMERYVVAGTPEDCEKDHTGGKDGKIPSSNGPSTPQ